MSEVTERLRTAGHELPDPPGALGTYRPARRAGGLVFTAGQLPLRDGSLITSGRVGAEVPSEVAKACASQAALNALAAASTVCGLDEVAAVVRLTGYVSSAPGFTAQPGVVDGASEVMLAAFGDDGAHSRVAVGVAALPLGAPVEIEVVLALRG
jgi:enamine deaminase RidA (YjgF/YER057c/UK114 family)